MRRRDFIGVLTTTLLGVNDRAFSQAREKLPRIGVLVSASPPHPFADALRRGLRNLGYTEGRNIALELRYTEGRSDRAAERAAELVRLGVDVIVAHFTPAVRGGPRKRSRLSWRRPAPPCKPASSTAWLALGETSRAYQRWMRRSEANAAAPPRTHSEPWPRRSSRVDHDHRPVQRTLRGEHTFGRHESRPPARAGTGQRP